PASQGPGSPGRGQPPAEQGRPPGAGRPRSGCRGGAQTAAPRLGPRGVGSFDADGPQAAAPRNPRAAVLRLCAARRGPGRPAAARPWGGRADRQGGPGAARADRGLRRLEGGGTQGDGKGTGKGLSAGQPGIVSTGDCPPTPLPEKDRV